MDSRLVVPVDAEPVEVVISGAFIIGNLYKSAANANALSSMVVINEGKVNRFGISSNLATVFRGRVGISVAEVPADVFKVGISLGLEVPANAFEVRISLGLQEPIDIRAVVSFSGLNVTIGIPIDTFESRTFPPVFEASVNIGTVSGVSSAFSIKEAQTACAVRIILFSGKLLENVCYSQ